jgi:nitrogen fixation-related uncharacterized protein
LILLLTSQFKTVDLRDISIIIAFIALLSIFLFSRKSDQYFRLASLKSQALKMLRDDDITMFERESRFEKVELASETLLTEGVELQASIDGIIQQISSIKKNLLNLVKNHPRNAKVLNLQPGGNASIKIVDTICGVCDDVIRALREGVGYDNQPISRDQITSGLKRLTADARNDHGIVCMYLSVEGSKLYLDYLKQLDKIATLLKNLR